MYSPPTPSPASEPTLSPRLVAPYTTPGHYYSSPPSRRWNCRAPSLLLCPVLCSRRWLRRARSHRLTGRDLLRRKGWAWRRRRRRVDTRSCLRCGWRRRRLLARLGGLFQGRLWGCLCRRSRRCHRPRLCGGLEVALLGLGMVGGNFRSCLLEASLWAISNDSAFPSAFFSVQYFL